MTRNRKTPFPCSTPEARKGQTADRMAGLISIACILQHMLRKNAIRPGSGPASPPVPDERTTSLHS